MLKKWLACTVFHRRKFDWCDCFEVGQIWLTPTECAPRKFDWHVKFFKEEIWLTPTKSVERKVFFDVDGCSFEGKETLMLCWKNWLARTVFHRRKFDWCDYFEVTSIWLTPTECAPRKFDWHVKFFKEEIWLTPTESAQRKVCIDGCTSESKETYCVEKIDWHVQFFTEENSIEVTTLK